jgi:phosphorylcholine metabolism protein LicD
MYLNKLYIILIWDTRNNEQYIITSPDLDTWTYEYPFYENNDINYILSGVSTFGAMTGVYTTNYYTIT